MTASDLDEYITPNPSENKIFKCGLIFLVGREKN